MDRLGVVFLLSLCTVQGRRLRRQTLPSQHIQVHSLHSNVLFDKYITVISAESRIDMTEKNVNGSLWSGHSTVTFDSYDTFVNCSAQQAESFFNLQNSANLYAQGNDIDFYMRTNRTQDGHSNIVHDLVGDVNVSIEDNGLRVQGVHGQRAGIEALTWNTSHEKSMHIAASNLSNGQRELVLIATAPLYHVRICFLGATVYVEFGDKIVQIGGDYTSVRIHTDKYSIVAKTNGTPYDVSLTNEEILIRCPNESTMLRVLPSGVAVSVEQLNRLQIDRGGGKLSLGSNVLAADVVNVTALSTDLNLENTGRVTAHAMNSHIAVQTPVQNVGMTSAHHVLRVEGGAPKIVVNTGRSCIEVTASHGLPKIEGLMHRFVTPEDTFKYIGPDHAPPRPTLPPDIAASSFPIPDALGGPPVFFNGSDRCVICSNRTIALSTTRLPTSLTPTFPPKTSTTATSTIAPGQTFPTLISLPSEGGAQPPGSTLAPSEVSSEVPGSSALPFGAPGATTASPEGSTAGIATTPAMGEEATTATAQPSVTSDQFVIGQFEDYLGEEYTGATTIGEATVALSAPPSPSPTPVTTPAPAPVTTPAPPSATTPAPTLATTPAPTPVTTSTPPPSTTPAPTPVTTPAAEASSTVAPSTAGPTESFPTPIVLPPGTATVELQGGAEETTPSAPTTEEAPVASTITGGGGGSWETETLFPTPSTAAPRKPSVLVLKMKIPSSLDLQSFDLASNLTAALNEVVKDSVKRVRRSKRSLPEQDQSYFVQVHKIERNGNAVRVLFSVNETEVDSSMVEKDLSSLDRNYLTRFFSFPLLSSISAASLDNYLDFVVLGSLTLALSVAFICYIFRATMRQRIQTVLARATQRLSRFPFTEKVTNITIITDDFQSA